MKSTPQLFVDNLTVIDCAYLDHARGLVGESWIVDIILGGTLDAQGMMMDFAHVKRDIKKAIDNSVDHSLIIPAKSEHLSKNSTTNDKLEIIFQSKDGAIEHHSPRDAVTLIDAEIITAEIVNDYIVNIIEESVPKNVTYIECSLRTEIIDGPSYHYCHGLKKHDGNCRRIAHGHRSRIDIWQNQEKNLQLEEKWTANFSDIYIGTKEDIIEVNDTHTIFQYESTKGSFYLSLPTNTCYIINEDSTVEHIAGHIAQASYSGLPIKVKAYEGVGKGAISEV